MKFNKWMKVIVAGSSILALTACSSHRRPMNYSSMHRGHVKSAYGHHEAGARTSGLGKESGFGDSINNEGKERILAKRVYYFNFDSNVVHQKDKPAINANADFLASHPGAKVLLEGHTDPRGSREYNVGLGERRAKSVAAILSQKGVSPSQIRIVSYGAEKLASPGRTEAAYQMDRRVVLVYLKS